MQARIDKNVRTVRTQDSKYPKVSKSVQRYLNIPQSTQKYTKVPRKYLEEGRYYLTILNATVAFFKSVQLYKGQIKVTVIFSSFYQMTFVDLYLYFPCDPPTLYLLCLMKRTGDG